MIDVVFVVPPTHEKEVLPFPLHPQTLAMLVAGSGKSTKVVDLPHAIFEGSLPFPDGALAAALDIIRKHPASVYVFTVYLSRSSSFPWVYALAEGIKAMQPDAMIILGGAQFAAMKQRALEQCPFIDVLCGGEMEPLICDLVDRLINSGNQCLADAGQICYRDQNGKIIRDQTVHQPTDVATLPLLDLPYEYYSPNAITSVEAGRGCPQTCTFCSCRWVATPRFKSVTRLLDEIEATVCRCDPDDILMIEQDNLIVDAKYIHEFAEEKDRRGLTFSYACFGRLDDLVPQVIEDLARSSCKVIYVGLESGSKTVLQSVGKRINLEHALPRVRSLTERGVFVNTNFMYGYPAETLDDLFCSLSLMAESRWAGAAISVSVLRPDPGSQLDAEIGDEQSIFLLDEPYHSELVAAGIRPRQLPRPFAVRFWAIQNTNYDLNHMAPRVEAFVYLLDHVPVTLAILIKSSGIGIPDLIEHMPHSHQGTTISPLDLQNMLPYFDKVLEGREYTELHRELIRYEILRARWLQGDACEGEKRFNSLTQTTFQKIADNPVEAEHVLKNADQ